MKCRCGKEIKNVPEHLAQLADWLCEECTNLERSVDSRPKRKQSSQPVDSESAAA